VCCKVDYTCFRAKAYFIDTESMHFMPLGHEMHVPCINEIYLGQETCWLCQLGVTAKQDSMVCHLLLSTETNSTFYEQIQEKNHY